jgi:hypothetical protein
MTAQGRCGAELAWSSPKAGLRGALRMSPPGATPRLPADGPDRVNLRRTTHGQRQMSAFAPTAHHTVGMNRPAMLSLAIVGLAVSACGSTRHVNTAGCVSEVKFHNVAYCSYGDVTGTNKHRPTHPLGDAQPWHDGAAIESRSPVAVRGFTSVSSSKVIAVTAPNNPRELRLYMTEDSTRRWRRKIVTELNLSNAL